MAQQNNSAVVLETPQGLPDFVRRRMGKKAERRFRKICRRFILKGRSPEWLIQIVEATYQEDLAGADFFAETRDGYRIPIDIKATWSAAYQFEVKLSKRHEDRSHIVILVVDEHQLEFDIWCTMIEKVSIRRLELIAKRAAAG